MRGIRCMRSIRSMRSMRSISVIIGLLCCMSICAVEYMGTMRMGSGYALENVRVSMDEKGSITLYHVKFARLMPVRVDVVIPHVKKRKDGERMILSGDNIIPTVKGKPYPNRTVTKLHGQADVQYISFRCLFGDKEMQYSGKAY